MTNSIFKEVSLDDLFGNDPFLYVKNKLIFRKDGKFLAMQIVENQQYKVSDYANLPSNIPFELLNGNLLYLAPLALPEQLLAIKLMVKITEFCSQNQAGTFFYSPNVLQLDDLNVLKTALFIFSEQRKFQQNNNLIKGIPNVAVEIMAEKNEKNWKAKMEIYAKKSITELWIINSQRRNIELYASEFDSMELRNTFNFYDNFVSEELEGFSMNLREFF